MKMMIDIPENSYKATCNGWMSPLDVENVVQGIKNGIKLPEGHGRLGDLDKIQSMARKKAEDCFPEGRYDYGYRKALFDFAKDVDDTPTIIEADKDETNEGNN